jgi:hypothetical protein
MARRRQCSHRRRSGNGQERRERAGRVKTAKRRACEGSLDAPNRSRMIASGATVTFVTATVVPDVRWSLPFMIGLTRSTGSKSRPRGTAVAVFIRPRASVEMLLLSDRAA